ncbi:MAG: dihydrolipoyl dehydrogenase [Pseudomonadota bacterium]
MEFDVVIVGAGPGGYVAAIRAAQLGLKTALVEKHSELGGTCLNIGCIPSKALLESSELFAAIRDRSKEHGIGVGSVDVDLSTMMHRKQRIVSELVDGLRLLMKKNKISVFEGKGKLIAPSRVEVVNKKGTEELLAKSIVLATGSVPVELPTLPFDGKHVVSSTEALSFDQIPKHLVVIGAGAIGLELGSVWSRLGAAVTVIEMLGRIAPSSDLQMAKLLQRALKQQGFQFQLNCQVTEAKTDANELLVSFKDSDGKEGQLKCDKVLVAVGRRPFTQDLGLEKLGVELDKQGRIKVDVQFRTNIAGVFAIGDLVGGPMLAHKAEEEGVAVAEILAGKKRQVDYETIPSVIYTWPELAEVGLNEEAAKGRNLEYKIGRYYFKANGRAKTMGETEGMVKLLADAKTDRLIGAHILGPRASDMIAQLVTALGFSATAEALASTCFAHPSLSEAVKEAALSINGQVLHG